MADWPGPIAAITLFVEDLPRCRTFYLDVFGLPVHFEDDVPAVLQFGGILVNLLAASEASELNAPASVAPAQAGVRSQFTLAVDDVDATCERLLAHGVDFLNGPMDRPWGIRTAAFRDPAGHVWEIAH